MASARDMRLRIKSIRNISQVTKALETVSASKVRRATQAYEATQPYAEKAMKLLVHLARQPGGSSVHPLLRERDQINHILVIVISSDRGLSGSYNANILRTTLDYFSPIQQPVSYVAVGWKGREMLLRRKKAVVADFSGVPPAPTFSDVSAIGQLGVDDYLNKKYDQVFIVYTEFVSLLRQVPTVLQLLPLKIEYSNKTHANHLTHKTNSVFTYEPDDQSLLDEIIPRLTKVQIYRCILSSAASEHAARRMAMRSATENAREMLGYMQLEYNNARQQAITNEMLDIISGAEASRTGMAH